MLLKLLQFLSQVLSVPVPIDLPFGIGKPHAVDYAAVVQFIADDHVPLAHQLGDQASIGGEAGLIDQRCGRLLETGQAPFQLQMQVERSGDRPHRA